VVPGFFVGAEPPANGDTQPIGLRSSQTVQRCRRQTGLADF
jgi:hypothetical protein